MSTPQVGGVAFGDLSLYCHLQVSLTFEHIKGYGSSVDRYLLYNETIERGKNY